MHRRSNWSHDVPVSILAVACGRSRQLEKKKVVVRSAGEEAPSRNMSCCKGLCDCRSIVQGVFSKTLATMDTIHSFAGAGQLHILHGYGYVISR